MKTKNPRSFFAAACAAFLLLVLAAGESRLEGASPMDLPYSVTVVDHSIFARAPLTVGDTNFNSLFNAFMYNSGDFAPYWYMGGPDAENYTGTFRHENQANAFRVNVYWEPYADNKSVTVEVPLLSGTANGNWNYSGNWSDVNSSVMSRMFDAAGTYDEFLVAMAALSTVISDTTIMDGTPSSSTAKLADVAFMTDGFTPAEQLVEATSGAVGTAKFLDFGIGMNTGKFKMNGVRGTFVDAGIPYRQELTSRMDLSAALSLNFMDVEGMYVYGVGLNLALPIRLSMMDKSKRLNWRVTPLAGTMMRWSRDTKTGGMIWMGGLSTTLDFRVSRQLIVSWISQGAYYGGISVPGWSGYDFNSDTSQVLLKNGVRGVTRFGKRVIADLFVINTDFLQDAWMNDYWTFGGSVQFRVTRTSNLVLGGNLDRGNDYKSWSVGITSLWSF